jgi:hypothetical protein
MAVWTISTAPLVGIAVRATIGRLHRTKLATFTESDFESPIAATGRRFQLKSDRTFAALAASLADKQRLEIGPPEIIRLPIRADRERMRAAKVLVINQQPANALFADLGKR